MADLTNEQRAEFSRIGKSNVSRSKSHERAVAKMLTSWSGIPFRRRRAEGRGQLVIEVEGAADVIAVGADFNFSVEAKCGSGFSLNALLANPHNNLFTDWWLQATYDANIMSASKSRHIWPMLFFRPYANANWLAIPTAAMVCLCPSQTCATSGSANEYKTPFNNLTFDGYSRCGEIEGNISHSRKSKKMVKLRLPDVVLCRWCDFAAVIDHKTAFTPNLQ